MGSSIPEPARPLPSPDELLSGAPWPLAVASVAPPPQPPHRSRCSASSSIRMRRSSRSMTLPCRRASVLSSPTWPCSCSKRGLWRALAFVCAAPARHNVALPVCKLCPLDQPSLLHAEGE